MRGNKLRESYMLDENYDLRECIKGLKLFFDNTDVNFSSFVKENNIEKFKEFSNALDYMYDNFKD